MFCPGVSRCICDVSRRSAIVYLANAVFPRCPEPVCLSIHRTRHTYQGVAFPSCDRILTALHSCSLIFTSWVLYDVNRRISVLKRLAIYLRVPRHSLHARPVVLQVFPNPIQSRVSELSRLVAWSIYRVQVYRLVILQDFVNHIEHRRLSCRPIVLPRTLVPSLVVLHSTRTSLVKSAVPAPRYIAMLFQPSRRVAIRQFAFALHLNSRSRYLNSRSRYTSM